MRTATIAVFTILACLMSGAQAQVFCWNTKDGKRQCGDTPPPGVKATALRTPSAPAAPPAPAGAKDAASKDAAAKDAKKGPQTPAEQEQAYRKRQLDAEKSRDKEQQALQDAETKKQNCERAREALRILESGQRIARVDKEGERYYIDEAQTAQESEKARQAVQRSCS